MESRVPAGAGRELANRGFAYGNNRGLEHTDARYVLLLNPDTEIIDGTFGELVDAARRAPACGSGRRAPADRRRHTVADDPPLPERRPRARRGALLRALAGPPGVGRASACSTWSAYERERECDWTSGSFMLARREALLSAGLLDERFFIYSEEPDLCLRIKRAGWQVRHLPQMTIVHHAGKGGVRPRMVAQDAYARKQYAQKHFGGLSRAAFVAACALGLLIRAICPGGSEAEARRAGARLALGTLLGRVAPPFGAPPPTAVSPPASGRDRARAAPYAVFDEVR